ncbi:MAG: hypothetical protein GY925_18640 [Actinomycetia bacterium]|nr:hypothetical protein [Actinomycetes bacterium]
MTAQGLAFFGINETNLRTRQEFIRLDADDAAVLKELIPWIQDAAPGLARSFYDWQFSFEPTARFLRNYATDKNTPLPELRSTLENTMTGYLIEVFTGAETQWGLDYFEKRLHVGVVYDTINLPFKWYVGSYSEWRRLIREALTEHYSSPPDRRNPKNTNPLSSEHDRDVVDKVMVSVEKVFSLDLQAIGEAFIGATINTLGLQFDAVATDAESDRMEHLDQIKTWTEVLKDQASILSGAAGNSSTLDQHVPGAIGDGFAAVIDKVRAIAGSVSTVSVNIDSLAAAGEELGVTASEIAERSLDISSRAAEAAVIADEASHAVIRLDDSSEEVGKVVESIASVANQTNMLALNATIEAARAGEAGRGFAVVASEVKELANQTAAATGEIDEKIKRIRSEISGAVSLISSIVEHVRQVNDGQDAMSSAIGHQTGAVEELGQNLLTVSNATGEIRAQVEMDDVDPAGQYTLS